MGYSFVTAAAKHLSLVEIDRSSNQHEFNGVASLKRMFGPSKQYFDARFIYYDETGEVIQENGQVTWYDARELNPLRTEYRLYYTDNNVVRKASSGDLLIVGRKDDNSLSIVIAKSKSTYYTLFMKLFGLDYITDSYVFAKEITI